MPANAELEIDLEVVSWKKVTQVTDDGLVMKKTLQKGKGYDKPKEMATVTIRYTARLEDGTVFEERGEGNELEFVTDEGRLFICQPMGQVTNAVAAEEDALLFLFFCS